MSRFKVIYYSFFIQVIIVCSIFYLNNSITISQTNFWERTNGPNEGHINDICLSQDGILYIGTGGGVYKSSDNGNIWNFTGLANFNVSTIAVSLNGIMYAGTYSLNNIGISGVYISTNYGLNWQLTSLNNQFVNDIEITSKGTVLVTTWYPIRGCFRSTNNGISWEINQEINNWINNEISIGLSNNIFIALGDASYAKSSNDGINWQIFTDSLAYSLGTIDASIPGYIFAGSNFLTGGLYRSTNNGINWEKINYQNIYEVTKVRAITNGYVFAGTNYAGIWRSSDFGNNWLGYWYPDSNSHVTTISKTYDNSILCGFYMGTLFKSTNNGDIWYESVSGLNSGFVNSILKLQNENIIAGTIGGLHLSTDSGINWIRCSIGYKRIYCTSQNSSGDLFVFGDGGYKSSDFGVNWTRLSSLGTGIFSSMILNNGLIFIGYSTGSIYKSSNNGVNWILNFSTNGSIVTITKDLNGSIYASSNSKIFRSLDNGTNWELIFSTTTDLINTLAVSQNGTIYAGKKSSIIFSYDSGVSWLNLNLNKDVRAITFDNNGNIIVGTNGDGIYYYNSSNWTELNSGLENKKVYSLGFNDQNQLLAGTYGSGVNKSTGIIGINPISTEIPNKYSLSQNYPNPFNPFTKIKFQIPLLRGVDAGGEQGVFTKLSIFDILGKEVTTIVNEKLRPGTYEVEWNASAYPSGVYFYRLQTESFTQTMKMVLVK